MSTAVMERPEVKNVMRLMDPQLGDLELKWDEDKPDEVAIARAGFEKAKKRGLAMFKMGRMGRKTGVQLHNFDPSAEKIIGMAPMVGG